MFSVEAPLGLPMPDNIHRLFVIPHNFSLSIECAKKTTVPCSMSFGFGVQGLGLGERNFYTEFTRLLNSLFEVYLILK
jgi:hypothetical protein